MSHDVSFDHPGEDLNASALSPIVFCEEFYHFQTEVRLKYL